MVGFLSLPKRAVVRFVEARAAAAQGLRTKVFQEWSPELDEALGSLPETAVIPHELFTSLMKMADPSKRRIILVTEEKGAPIAIAGLRDRWGYWEPVTQWIVPGMLFPVKEGFLERVLPALSLQIRIAWWRWRTNPPGDSWVRNAIPTPTHGIDCKEDFEAYWRRSKKFGKNIRLYRNRCHAFELKVDLQGTTEWTIRKSEEKWRKKGMKESPDLAEKLLVAEYLNQKGLYHTLSLMDRNRTAAGITFIIHGNDAVAHINYRDPDYDYHGVMTRLMDASFTWARESGFEKIDIGGSFDYKEKWAPENGVKWEFDVYPNDLLPSLRALGKIRDMHDRLEICINRVRERSSLKKMT